MMVPSPCFTAGMVFLGVHIAFSIMTKLYMIWGWRFSWCTSSPTAHLPYLRFQQVGYFLLQSHITLREQYWNILKTKWTQTHKQAQLVTAAAVLHASNNVLCAAPHSNPLTLFSLSRNARNKQHCFPTYWHNTYTMMTSHLRGSFAHLSRSWLVFFLFLFYSFRGAVSKMQEKVKVRVLNGVLRRNQERSEGSSVLYMKAYIQRSHKKGSGKVQINNWVHISLV